MTPLVACVALLYPALQDAAADAALAPGQESPRIGRIVVEENTVTDERVIRNRLPFRPGHRLRYSQLAEGRANLHRLGLFDGPPVVDVLSHYHSSPTVDVVVRVKETRTGMFSLNWGCNSNFGLRGDPAPKAPDCSESLFPAPVARRQVAREPELLPFPPVTTAVNTDFWNLLTSRPRRFD